jgi:hypothetical protein
MKQQLLQNIRAADYIIVPSRRVFANQSCALPDDFVHILSFDRLSLSRCKAINQEFPVSSGYYSQLFSGNLSFEKVAEFTAYPQISIGGIIIWRMPDEEAEETWSVFDHPTIRIYKRIYTQQYARSATVSEQ